jgi:hypothetical protein
MMANSIEHSPSIETQRNNKPREKKTNMMIQVKIGDTSVNYVIKLTRAPREYDGFGTFTVQIGMPDHFRLIAIREEHSQWQMSRNSSGNFATTEPEDIDQQNVENALWKRLWRGDERGVA